MARPTADFNQKVADHICDAIADGKPLVRVLRQCKLKNAPKSRMTVYKWLRENQKFMDSYVRARELQADSLFDDIIDIADDDKHQDGKAHRMIDARKFLAAKLRPRQYGEAPLLQSRVKREEEQEMINITPTDEGEVELLDDKKLARVIWHTLFAPKEEKDVEPS